MGRTSWPAGHQTQHTPRALMWSTAGKNRLLRTFCCDPAVSFDRKSFILGLIFWGADFKIAPFCTSLNKFTNKSGAHMLTVPLNGWECANEASDWLIISCESSKRNQPRTLTRGIRKQCSESQKVHKQMIKMKFRKQIQERVADVFIQWWFCTSHCLFTKMSSFAFVSCFASSKCGAQNTI